MASKKKQKALITPQGPNYFMLLLIGVVLLQSFLLISNASKKESPKEEKPLKTTSALPLEEKNNSQVKLALSPSGISLRKGEAASVDLVLTPKKPLRLDGADIVLSYDPDLFLVSEISTPRLFSLVTQKRTDEKSGRVYLTFLEEKEGGLLLSKEAKLLSLRIKGKATGEGEISIINGDKGTTLIGSGNSQKLTFDKGNTKVVVY
ncbi:hypothetical protein C4578_01905 [Candidatus Microgenomates bacterium]|jgi:hypothetical protein|nr:MAG: hypothetical protein C4578_01905 [Candidatus Microgenomates bacterium]